MYLPANTLLQDGTYRIVRPIGSGDFGYIYEARHVMLEKKVAIKEFFVKNFCERDEATLHVRVSAQAKGPLIAKLKEKFINEAKGISRLEHVGIIRVSDVFEENDTAYYVMDYIEGRSLQDIIDNEGPLIESRALKYISQIAEALRFLHRDNRLHLDVKPSNIMITDSDNAVLIDFSVSKQYDIENGVNTSSLSGRTPGYAPPEQLTNQIINFSPVTDIYALGATLYRLLSGEIPSDSALRGAGMELKPLPSQISESTRNAVYAALEINKKDRPQTIDDFMALLRTKTGQAVIRDVIPDSDVEIISAPDNVIRKDRPLLSSEENPIVVRRFNDDESPIIKRCPENPETHSRKYGKMAVVLYVIAGLIAGFLLSRLFLGD